MLINPYVFAAGGGGASYRYWRLKIDGWKNNGNTNNGDVRVAEWGLFTAANVHWPTNYMTGPSSPSPFVASASSDDGSRPAWQAFDRQGSDSYRWISNSSDTAPWLKIDMGSAQVFTYMKLTPDGAVAVGGGYFITAFTVEGSNTGSFSGEEAAVYSTSGLVQGDWSANTPKTFTF